MSTIKFYKESEDKKRFLDLLLLADEQEDMIDRYLGRGELWLIDDGGVKGICVVTDEGDSVLEIKNLAVAVGHQREGYGKAMVDFIKNHYKDKGYSRLRVGTGDSLNTMPFYLSCGFKVVGRIADFFTDNYYCPIIEAGVLLRDMVILEQVLS